MRRVAEDEAARAATPYTAMDAPVALEGGHGTRGELEQTTLGYRHPDDNPVQPGCSPRHARTGSLMSSPNDDNPNHRADGAAGRIP